MKQSNIKQDLSENNAQLYFHLGLPKTASTFMQVNLFPYLNNITYYRKRHFKKYKSLNPSELSGKYLFSTEKDNGFEEAVADIAEKFPGAKVIICLRKHEDWIMSKYKYYIRKYGYLTFGDFFSFDREDVLWTKDDLIYRNKIEVVEKYLGDKPLVLDFEVLKKDPELFAKQICDFMEVDYNKNAVKFNTVKKAFSKKQLIILRAFNRFYKMKEYRYKQKTIKKIYKTYRKFILHIVAFLSQFVPAVFVKNKELIYNKEILSEIAGFYNEDWQYCKNYSL